MVSDFKKAAEKAIHALEDGYGTVAYRLDAIHSLKTALKELEQPEPYGYVTVVKRDGCQDQHWFYRTPELPYLDNAAEYHAVYTTPPRLETKQSEPMATLWQHGETGRTRITRPGDITDCDASWFKAADLFAAPPAQTPPLTTCNCRWDGETQVQQCTLHEAHVDAIHEWAERAKSAEAKLKTPPPRLTDEALENIRIQCASEFAEGCRTGSISQVKTLSRAIETAVRKQFLGDRDE